VKATPDRLLRVFAAVGAAVWLAFVADTRCMPIEGDRGRTTKAAHGPQYVRNCRRAERNNLRQRIATLLAHGVDPKLAVLDGWSKPMGSPLCFAVGAGIWEGVHALIANQASCQAPCRGNSILHRVAELEDPTLTCKLIACGAEVNAKDGLGDTPVILAAKHGDAKTVSILLDYGADPAARDKRGETAMSVAVRLGRRSVIRILDNWAKLGAITRSLCRP